MIRIITSEVVFSDRIIPLASLGVGVLAKGCWKLRRELEVREEHLASTAPMQATPVEALAPVQKARAQLLWESSISVLFSPVCNSSPFARRLWWAVGHRRQEAGARAQEVAVLPLASSPAYILLRRRALTSWP